MFFETHTHLTDEQFDLDRDQVLANARTAGVSGFVEIGEQESQWEKARALAESQPDVYWTAGFHPYYAFRADPGLAGRLEEALAHPRCVAVGEIGLDYHRDDSPPDVQRTVLEELIGVAVRRNKPIVLHCREAHRDHTQAQKDLLSVLSKFYPVSPGVQPGFCNRREDRDEGDRDSFDEESEGHGGSMDEISKEENVRPPSSNPASYCKIRVPPAGVAHCFQGNAETAWALIERGFLIGVDAPITYPASSSLRALLAHLPLESLVLETDSPYLPPQDHRGRRNEPTHIPTIAQTLADIKHIPIEKIGETTTANAQRLYRIP